MSDNNNPPASGPKMATASDIITYIGVPLAVLGVMPTMYTCLKSYLTLRTIRQTLQSNGVAAITRSTLLSGIVEAEISRKSIVPLDRKDPQYFELSNSPSTLKGGSWTIFNWKEMVIGMKPYRLQYHDELMQPQAEVDFEQLVAFLLDRGAVPSPVGFDDLRNLGLWTPAGTKLLVSPTTADAVLMVAPPDDSDGILSLSLQWRPEWDRRDYESLPPYFVRIRAPEPENNMISLLEPSKKTEEADETEDNTDDKSLKTDKENENSIVSKASSHIESSFRMRIGPLGVQEAYDEDDLKFPLELAHLSSKNSLRNNTISQWFACAATAVGAPSGGLWSYAIPADITALARKESIPCGVMVLSEFMSDDETPTWRTPIDDRAERFEKDVQMQNRTRMMMEEMRLPQAEQAAARQKRFQQESMNSHHQMQRDRIERQRRQEQEITEALTSQRLGINLVARHSLKWLVAHHHHQGHNGDSACNDVTSTDVVEQVLYGMIRSERIARDVAGMLDRWRNWTEMGGMSRADFQFLKDNKPLFAMAACVLALLNDILADAARNVISDLQECLRIWRRVRLG